LSIIIRLFKSDAATLNERSRDNKIMSETSISEFIQVLIEWVFRYLKRGWKVVPIPYGKKNPVQDDWQHLDIKEDDLQSHFPGKSNVGLILKRIKDLVVVDLDCLEANEIADEFLTPTELEGARESAPRSHRFHILEGAPPKGKLKYIDPTISDDRRAMIVELLVNGQVVVAPSVYSDGEKCVWHKFGEPSRVEANKLVTAMAILATVVLFARHWIKGIRHDASVILAGALAHAGYAREEVKKIIAAICRLAKDEESASRLNDVDTTFDKYEHGEPVSGWPKMEEEGLFDTRVVKQAKEWLDHKSKAKKKAKPSVADVVREILTILDIIRLESKEVFVTYLGITGKRTCAIDSEEFSTWVRDYFFDNYDHILDSGTLKNILPILARSARLTDQQVYMRVAYQDGTTFIDLNNDEQEIVKITAEGWEVKKL
jgi:hypothetical protein